MPDGGRLTIAIANAMIDTKTAHRDEIDAGPYVVISVADSGTGMTKQTTEKAFEPFFTTKEVGRGTGLGLSQVYGFVKQSGGYVQLDSEVGRGTTVRLYLPRAVAEAPPDAAAPPEGEAALFVAQTGKASSSSSGSP
jgi:signal transduction histidine kinase